MTHTVLVTGGAGYIGSHAVLALIDEGFQVAVLDNLSTGHRWAVPAAAKFYHGDVADANMIDRISTEVQPVAILHFAGSIDVSESPVGRVTGGVGAIIRNGDNGLLLPPEADGPSYADAIAAVWKDPARYSAMQDAARSAFVERLNWQAWGETMAQQVQLALGGNRRG